MAAREDAVEALSVLKQSVLTFLTVHPEGSTNAEIADGLNLRSNFEGKQKDYLSYSILGLLIGENKVHYAMVAGRKRYFVGKRK